MNINELKIYILNPEHFDWKLANGIFKGKWVHIVNITRYCPHCHKDTAIYEDLQQDYDTGHITYFENCSVCNHVYFQKWE